MTAEMEVDDSPRPNIVINLKRKLSNLVQIEVEPVGKWYHYYELARLKNRHTPSTDDASEEEETSEEEEEEEEGEEEHEVEIEDDITYLRSLDPADWKNQDHYSVLGLKRYRYKASDEDIKKAYRMMVLRHHPDKRTKAAQPSRDDDDYFTCITRAYEVLGVPAKRRAYDSVDPEFDDDIPSASDIRKGDFFEVFASVIERNTRWSMRKHVPLLGKSDDTKQKVDKFYNFWFDFDSWREFSYLDEEEKEKGQDREERRWIEKQNKVERARRRKEEMTRLRKMVDSCYNADPRVARFREEERERKAAVKKARQEAIRKKAEEEERLRREAEDRLRAAKEAADAEARAKVDAERREREAAKKILKKERKTLRCACKERRYFAEDEGERVQLMTDVELLCEALHSADLHDLNERLAAAPEDAARDLLLQQVAEVKVRVDMEREEVRIASLRPSGGGSASGEGSSGTKSWTSEDIQLLIKAVNLFPAGTSKRWDVVAEYLNQHSSSTTNRVAKDVLSKAKELQNCEQQMKEAAKKTALQAREKTTSAAQSQQASLGEMNPSVRLETPQEMLGVNLSAWSAEEQRLLEQALKTFSSSTADRWDCIADCLPNRSKKECMKRYKELVEMVKAKKAAQAAAAKN